MNQWLSGDSASMCPPSSRSQWARVQTTDGHTASDTELIGNDPDPTDWMTTTELAHIIQRSIRSVRRQLAAKPRRARLCCQGAVRNGHPATPPSAPRPVPRWARRPP